ncbi:MAG: DUF1616 domain-containing protein [Promethearchaeota archaeon]|nr:MAG: DUF1616 domain-containing protein [Candidatus Lokiarchaeota archaeon]
MSKNKPPKNISELELSYIQFQKLLRFSLIFGIILVSGFITYYVLFPEEGYIGFGILNEDERAEDYPTSAKVNQTINFYITVENQLDHKFTFKIIILRGDEDTKLSPEGSKHANKTSTTDKESLKPGEDWMSDKLSVSFAYNGTDQVLVVELWKYNEDNSREFWDILWLRLDIYS